MIELECEQEEDEKTDPGVRHQGSTRHLGGPGVARSAQWGRMLKEISQWSQFLPLSRRASRLLLHFM